MSPVICLLFIFASSISGQLVHNVQTALTLGNSSIDYNREDCIWKNVAGARTCPDPGVRLFLYKSEKKPEEVDLSQSDWLRVSSFDHTLDNVVLVHGYAGGDNTFPLSMLRDAYIRNGSYNVLVLDWGKLASLPCYPAAVHNIRAAAKCASTVFNMMRDLVPGGNTKITCVGHSLGAHLCCQISEYLRFRMDRIIGLDPAKPLVRNSFRLHSGCAEQVVVLHTNAGHYGESGKMGSVNFCLNGGRTQPHCTTDLNMEMCSHVMAVCFMAASLDPKTSVSGHPCARRCPSGTRPTHRLGVPILMGEHTPSGASGYYCVSTSSPPYCSRSPDQPGHPWCCLDGNSQFQTLQIPAPGEPANHEVEATETRKFVDWRNFILY